ncbi:hypothetical protein BO85DRAFT_441116 [Aspergillus piperis CBS 112811]|uniref:Uncharacterized protein n=1 Tax=Aspergillus piperis CBS 112811 TaxID=1448313 RepID=A0A8G1QUN2_9EURO|nr:hypothetical protein BO85DRAFT_441116 [Aspergillus piperis CBS 112811]RAH54671.1 hypothetical protein BO85DRAFT_441116 [Aspergillus piperis CBS 112811]
MVLTLTYEFSCDENPLRARDETETAAMVKTEAIPPSSLGRSGGAPDPSMVRAHKQADISGSEAAESEADDFLNRYRTLSVDFIMQLQSTEYVPQDSEAKVTSDDLRSFRFLRDLFVR